jgi:hypothetical protein
LEVVTDVSEERIACILREHAVLYYKDRKLGFMKRKGKYRARALLGEGKSYCERFFTLGEYIRGTCSI